MSTNIWMNFFQSSELVRLVLYIGLKDLKPLDYCLWGLFKHEVYKVKVHTNQKYQAISKKEIEKLGGRFPNFVFFRCYIITTFLQPRPGLCQIEVQMKLTLIYHLSATERKTSFKLRVSKVLHLRIPSQPPKIDQNTKSYLDKI